MSASNGDPPPIPLLSGKMPAEESSGTATSTRTPPFAETNTTALGNACFYIEAILDMTVFMYLETHTSEQASLSGELKIQFI